jgi:hypothetical protein
MAKIKIQHKVTHQIVEGDMRLVLGWWQYDGPGLLSVSYPASEWEQVQEDASEQGQ